MQGSPSTATGGEPLGYIEHMVVLIAQSLYQTVCRSSLMHASNIECPAAAQQLAPVADQHADMAPAWTCSWQSGAALCQPQV